MQQIVLLVLVVLTLTGCPSEWGNIPGTQHVPGVLPTAQPTP